MITAEMKLAAMKRELGFRKHVYPNRIAAGKMTQAKADQEIAVTEAIIADYQAIVDKEKAAGDLFGASS